MTDAELREWAGKIICNCYGYSADIEWHMQLVRAILADPAILAHIPAYAELIAQTGEVNDLLGVLDICMQADAVRALREENERLKEYQEGYKEAVAESDLAYRNHIADLESQLAALQQLADGRLEQLNADRRQYLDLRDQLAALQVGGEAWGYLAIHDGDDYPNKFAENPEYRKSQMRVVEDNNFRLLYTQAPASVQPAIGGKVPEGWDAEFLSKRLARVANLAGVMIPEGFSHEQVAEAAGTILGQIASAMVAAPESTPISAPISAIPPGYAVVEKHWESNIWYAAQMLQKSESVIDRNEGRALEKLYREVFASVPLSSAPIAEQDAKDAARYRFLQEQCFKWMSAGISVSEFNSVSWETIHSAEELNAAIDAAMLATNAGKEE